MALEDVWDQGRNLRRRQLPGSIAMQGAETVFPHYSLNSVLAARLSPLAQVQQDSRCTVDPVTGQERGPNQPKQPFIFLCPIRNRVFQPSVIASSSDTEKPAHRGNTESVPIRLDERLSFPRLALCFPSHGYSSKLLDGCYACPSKAGNSKTS